MDIQEAKDKLYYELLYTVREYGGTEADLLRLIDSFSYIDGKVPVFINDSGNSYSIKQSVDKRKSVLEKYLDNLDVEHEKEVSNTEIKYKLFNDTFIIKPDGDYYTVSIKDGDNLFLILYSLSFEDMINIVIDNKDRFQ